MGVLGDSRIAATLCALALGFWISCGRSESALSFWSEKAFEHESSTWIVVECGSQIWIVCAWQIVMWRVGQGFGCGTVNEQLSCSGLGEIGSGFEIGVWYLSLQIDFSIYAVLLNDFVSAVCLDLYCG